MQLQEAAEQDQQRRAAEAIKALADKVEGDDRIRVAVGKALKAMNQSQETEVEAEPGSNHRVIRWILVVPVAAAATVVIWFATALLYSVANFDSDPQIYPIVFAIGSAITYAAAAGSGVLAGYLTAPTRQKQAAVAVAALSVLFALTMLAFSVQLRDSLSMSIGLHIWNTVAWIAGAVAAVVAIWI